MDKGDITQLLRVPETSYIKLDFLSFTKVSATAKQVIIFSIALVVFNG